MIFQLIHHLQTKMLLALSLIFCFNMHLLLLSMCFVDIAAVCPLLFFSIHFVSAICACSISSAVSYSSVTLAIYDTFLTSRFSSASKVCSISSAIAISSFSSEESVVSSANLVDTRLFEPYVWSQSPLLWRIQKDIDKCHYNGRDHGYEMGTLPCRTGMDLKTLHVHEFTEKVQSLEISRIHGGACLNLFWNLLQQESRSTALRTGWH